MKILAKNKKIFFDYEIQDKLDVWIVLMWHEVKALKMQWANIKDAVVQIRHNELWLINMDIQVYKKVSWNTLGDYTPKWPRKLLITKQQLTRLRSSTQKTWLHIVPIVVYEAKNRKIKVTIWLAKRKKNIQKKQSIKDKDTKRQMNRDISRIRLG